MAPTPSPFPGQEPDLEPVKPLDRPGDDRIGNGLVRPPFVVGRVVETQGRGFGRVTDAVDVRRRLPGAPRVGAYQRLAHLHRHIGIGEKPAVEDGAGEIQDANAVGLGDRPQRPLPDPDPAGGGDLPELRVEGLDAAVLFFGGKRNHHSPSSPKKVLRGVGRATAGNAVPAPTAGIAPIPGTCTARPVSRSD